MRKKRQKEARKKTRQTGRKVKHCGWKGGTRQVERWNIAGGKVECVRWRVERAKGRRTRREKKEKMRQVERWKVAGGKVDRSRWKME